MWFEPCGAPSKGKEGFLHALVDLRRRLHELDAEFVGELAALFLGHCLLVRPVRLVANEDLVHALRRVLLNVCMPRPDVYKRALAAV